MDDLMFTIPTTLWQPSMIYAPQQLYKGGNPFWADICKNEDLLQPLTVLPSINESSDLRDLEEEALPTLAPTIESTNPQDLEDTIEPLATNFAGWHLSPEFSSILDTMAPSISDDREAIAVKLSQQEVGLTLRLLLDIGMLLYFTEHPPSIISVMEWANQEFWRK